MSAPTLRKETDQRPIGWRQLPEGRHAIDNAADRAAAAIFELLRADRKRSTTIQYMPDETLAGGCRFEIIGAPSGESLGVIDVRPGGVVSLLAEPSRKER